MEQKTVFYHNWPRNPFRPLFDPLAAKIGDEVILYTLTLPGGETVCGLLPNNGNDIYRNRKSFAMDRYHGVFPHNGGTVGNALGVRKIIAISLADIDDNLHGCNVHAITVGEDIHPDWE